MPQNLEKVGIGAVLVVGIALILLPAACSAMADAPDMYVPPQQIVHHDTVVVVPQPAAPRGAGKATPGKPAKRTPYNK